MKKYYKNKNSNCYFIADDFEPENLSKDWKEITEKQYNDSLKAEESTEE